MKYQVDILDIGGEPTAALRSFRTVAKMSLEHAARIHPFASGSQRTTLVAGIEKQVAEHVARELNDAGVATEVLQSSLETPMVCDPRANTRYRWGDLRTLRSLPPR